MTSPRISLAKIVWLAVAAEIASIPAFVLVAGLGGSRPLAVLLRAGASGAWFIAAYGRRSRSLGWDTLRTRFAAIDRPLMLTGVAAGLALNVSPNFAVWILEGAGVKVADFPNDALVPSGIDQLPLSISILVILVPFSEELLFRGLLLDWLMQKVAVWQAVLISSRIFALLHNTHLTMGLTGCIELLDRVLMGVGAAILALPGRSLRGPFLMHAANNLLVCITSALDI